MVQLFQLNFATIIIQLDVEGYNNKLKLYVGAAKPNIYKAIRVFQKEENSVCMAFERANSLDPKVNKPPARRTPTALLE